MIYILGLIIFARDNQDGYFGTIRGEINMEILLVLVIILVQFLVIRCAVHQGTLDALIEFEDYKNKKNKTD